jgi:hypothetical protein
LLDMLDRGEHIIRRRHRSAARTWWRP